MERTTPHARLCGHFNAKHGYGITRPNGINEWLLFYTIGGKGKFNHSDGSGTYSAPGELMLYQPNVRHSYWTANEMGWEFLWTHFTPRASWLGILKWPEALGPGLGRIVVTSKMQRTKIHKAMARLIEARENPSPFCEEMALNALEEVLLLSAEFNPLGHTGFRDDRVRQALNILAQNVAQPHTVATLSKAVGLSASRFAHLFREEVGKSVIDTLIQLRLQQAAKLLESTNMSVKAIAAETGFNSPYYFSRLFKQKIKTTPQAYRKASFNLISKHPKKNA
ncbi:MAG: helix-turn-helix domain-containing protein [Verrucomicrobiota bacterium]|nr:helix-turn-helix domain-containing protein [Verrucomicrobiota bacterium]